MTAIEQIRNKLAEIRKIRGGFAKVARAAGVTPTTVSGWHRGDSLPTYDKLDAIASVAGTVVLMFADAERAAAAAGHAIPFIVSAPKGTVPDASKPSHTRPTDAQVSEALRASIVHIARVVLDELDETGRIEAFVNALPVEALPAVRRAARAQSRRRARAHTDNSPSPRADTGRTA